MNRGYAGYYNGIFLRSSYEYAYAKYLDFNKVKWKYEVHSFDLNFKIYKPDFFIYCDKGRLIKIIEVKSRDKNAKKAAEKNLETLEKLIDIKCELISYEEL